MRKENRWNHITRTIQEFCSKYLILTVAIIVLIIGVCSFFVTAYFNATFDHQVEKTSYKNDNIGLNILLIILALISLFLLCKLMKKTKAKYIGIAICIIIFVAQTLWVLHLRYISEADQKDILICADCMKNRQYANIMDDNAYLNKYPFLMGMVMYVRAVYKVFNIPHELLLQFLNVIYSTISIFLMYQITKILFKNKYIQNISLLLLTGFSLYFLFFNPHVYGNIIGLMFALIAILYTLKYLKRKKIKDLAIVAISITISIILKTNYNIFLCGIILVLTLEWFRNMKAKTVIGIAVILLVFSITQKGLTRYTENITGYSQDVGVPMISYIYMGMAEPKTLSSGWYTADTLRLYEENKFDREKIHQKSMELIGNRLGEFKQNPGMAFEFYRDKLASTWLNPTYQTIWCSLPGIRYQWYPDYAEYINHKKVILSMLSGKLYQVEETYFNIYQIIIFLSAFCGMIQIRNKKHLKYMLLPLIFLGGFVFHIFWETKAIYVLQYYFLLIPFSSFGLYTLYKKLRKIELKNFKEKKLLPKRGK